MAYFKFLLVLFISMAPNVFAGFTFPIGKPLPIHSQYPASMTGRLSNDSLTNIPEQINSTASNSTTNNSTSNVSTQIPSNVQYSASDAASASTTSEPTTASTTTKPLAPSIHGSSGRPNVDGLLHALGLGSLGFKELLQGVIDHDDEEINEVGSENADIDELQHLLDELMKLEASSEQKGDDYRCCSFTVEEKVVVVCTQN